MRFALDALPVISVFTKKPAIRFVADISLGCFLCELVCLCIRFSLSSAGLTRAAANSPLLLLSMSLRSGAINCSESCHSCIAVCLHASCLSARACDHHFLSAPLSHALMNAPILVVLQLLWLSSVDSGSLAVQRAERMPTITITIISSTKGEALLEQIAAFLAVEQCQLKPAVEGSH